jgi:hypothetical protein
MELAFLGWLRGEKRHRSMAAIPEIEEEDAKRPNREREKLVGSTNRFTASSPQARPFYDRRPEGL